MELGFDEIERLMLMMKELGVTRLSVKRGDFEVDLERAPAGGLIVTQPAQPAHHAHQQAAAQHVIEEMSHGKPPIAPSKEQSGIFITSPMVGTFYAAASPEEPAFVKVGDRVEESKVVCIIEAMKVMNEVKANLKGVIAEVLVENGQPVEFGTKLFRITE